MEHSVRQLAFHTHRDICDMRAVPILDGLELGCLDRHIHHPHIYGRHSIRESLRYAITGRHGCHAGIWLAIY